MKYTYTIVFIILIFNQILLIFASDNDELKDQNKSLSRNKRQTFKGLNSFIKRSDYNENELDELNNGNNQKKIVSFSWPGKRNDNQKQENTQHNLNTYLPDNPLVDNPLAAKRFRSWGGKRGEKPFRTWGGKRSDNDLKLNDYLKRLEALNFLINDLDLENYD